MATSSPNRTPFGVFVGELAPTVTKEDLLWAFAHHGAVGARVVRGKTGESMGFGFVYFSMAEEQPKAIRWMNKSVLHGRQIIVKAQHYNNPDRVMIKPGDRLGDLYVGNIPRNISRDEIERELHRLGVTKFNNIRIKSGFGFISFISDAAAQEALETLARQKSVKKLCGKDIMVHMFRNVQKYPVKVDPTNMPEVFGCTEEMEKARRTVHIRHFGNATVEDLKKMFSSFGRVTSCRIKQTKRPLNLQSCRIKHQGTFTTRYAFVEFETPEVAHKLVQFASQQQLCFGEHRMKIKMCKLPPKVQDLKHKQIDTLQLPAGTPSNLYQDPYTGQLYATQNCLGLQGASYAQVPAYAPPEYMQLVDMNYTPSVYATYSQQQQTAQEQAKGGSNTEGLVCGQQSPVQGSGSSPWGRCSSPSDASMSDRDSSSSPAPMSPLMEDTVMTDDLELSGEQQSLLKLQATIALAQQQATYVYGMMATSQCNVRYAPY